MRAIEAFRVSVTGRTISGILTDVVITIVLLAGLLVLHRLVELASLSQSFKDTFNRVHEKVVLTNYVVIALRGTFRVVSLPWRDSPAGGKKV